MNVLVLPYFGFKWAGKVKNKEIIAIAEIGITEVIGQKNSYKYMKTMQKSFAKKEKTETFVGRWNEESDG